MRYFSFFKVINVIGIFLHVPFVVSIVEPWTVLHFFKRHTSTRLSANGIIGISIQITNPAVPIPAVPIPAVPIPAVTLPAVTLPAVPFQAVPPPAVPFQAAPPPSHGAPQRQSYMTLRQICRGDPLSASAKIKTIFLFDNIYIYIGAQTVEPFFLGLMWCIT